MQYFRPAVHKNYYKINLDLWSSEKQNNLCKIKLKKKKKNNTDLLF